MKYLVLISLFVFFSCKSSKDLGSVTNPTVSPEPIVLNLDYKGEMLPAMRLDKLVETELKIIDPSGGFYSRDLLYTPVQGEPGSLFKTLPYGGEEIPAIHLDNSTFDKIRSTKGIIIVPKENEKK